MFEFQLLLIGKGIPKIVILIIKKGILRKKYSANYYLIIVSNESPNSKYGQKWV
jgi:hypothetical protein